MRPAEPHEIVPKRRRQVAHRAIGLDTERPVSLGKLGPVRPVDERHMGHARRVPTEQAIDRQLARGVGEVVVAAQDLRDAHVVIVDDDGQHVGRRAVAPQEDEVVQLLVPDRDVALNGVRDDGGAVLRHAQAYGEGRIRRLGRVAIAPEPVVTRRPGLRPAPSRAWSRALPASHSSDRRFRRARSSCATSAWRARRSDWKTTSPSQSSSSQRRPSRMASIAPCVERARSVSSIRRQEAATGRARQQPVEERGPRAPDMEISGGRRGESRYDV